MTVSDVYSHPSSAMSAMPAIASDIASASAAAAAAAPPPTAAAPVAAAAAAASTDPASGSRKGRKRPITLNIRGGGGSVSASEQVKDHLNATVTGTSFTPNTATTSTAPANDTASTDSSTIDTVVDCALLNTTDNAVPWFEKTMSGGGGDHPSDEECEKAVLFLNTLSEAGLKQYVEITKPGIMQLSEMEIGTAIVVKNYTFRKGQKGIYAVIDGTIGGQPCSVFFPRRHMEILQGRDLPQICIYKGTTKYNDRDLDKVDFVNMKKVRGHMDLSLVQCQSCNRIWDGNAQCNCYMYK